MSRTRPDAGRVRAFIEHLKKVPNDEFSLMDWECGSVACLAGQLARSKEFIASGGLSEEGCPFFEGYAGSGAVSWYLGLSHRLANQLCMPSQAIQAYAKHAKDVNPEDCIQVLERILNDYPHKEYSDE